VTFQLKRPPDPTLSVTASVPSATGSGATFSVTTARSATDGSYAVTGIKLTNGGVNYSLGDKIAFASNGCITEQPEATITIATTRPLSTNLRLTPASPVAIYSYANVSYSQQEDESGNPYWEVSDIATPGGFGSGYTEGSTVSLTPGSVVINFGFFGEEPGVVVQEAATARITQINRAAPTFGVRINRAGGGTFDGGFVVGRTQGTDANGREAWSVSSVGIGWWFPSDFTASDTVSFYMTGTTATTVRAATATIAVNESGAITSFTITDGGEYYDTQGRPTAVELLTAGRYYKPGVITSATLVSGGKVFGLNACEYTSDRVCAVCPVGDAPGDGLNKRELWLSVSLGATSNTATLYLRDWYQYGISNPGFADTAILTASQPSVDNQGKPILCDGFVFGAANVQGCSTNGTITLAAGECGTPTESYCDTEGNMPDQITLSLAGMGKLFLWSSQNGGAPGSPPTPMSDECDIQYDILIRGTGVATGPSGYAGNLVLQDFEAVLDRDERSDCFWSWSGYAPQPPFEAVIAGNVQVNCGDLSAPVSVSIGPVGLETTVFISPPTMVEGGETATGEASVSSAQDGGEIAGVTLLTPGSGYAREVFTRTEPEMTVALSGGTGSGAVLAATLTQSGEGEYVAWGVTAVAVTDGGTGYVGNEAVVFTPETGATTDSPASAYIITGRVEPTVTASASGGTGAELSVTLSQSTDWNGLDIWSVESVAVDDGGTGYTNGASVTFAVTDGVESYPASATIATVRGEPEVTASVPYSTGSGAVLTPVLSASGGSWTVASVTITDGGSGYSEWDQVLISTDDIEASGSYFYVSSVDGSGAITGIGSYGGGSYYRDTGVIESVNLSYYGGGEYYKSTGVIESVVVWEPGAYYVSESTGTSEVDVPVVSFRSYSGSGATATAEVDGELGSPTFGQITGVTVTNGGERYRPSGTGWALSISIASHLEVLLGDETPPSPNEEDAVDCANFWSKRLPFANRVSFEPCPADLLNKSYVMSAGAFSLPFGDPYGDGMGSAVWCRTPAIGGVGSPLATFFEFGNGEITCTISAG
jgi:hypothetical protein